MAHSKVNSKVKMGFEASTELRAALCTAIAGKGTIKF